MSGQASESTYGHFKIAPFDTYSFSIQERIRYLPARRIQNAGKSGSRYAHSLCARFLFQSFKIPEPYGLRFFNKKIDFINGNQRYSRRLEAVDLRQVADFSPDASPSHIPPGISEICPLNGNYERMTIIMVFSTALFIKGYI